MYSIYQNRYANKLHLNIIKVKYSKEHTLLERDFSIKLSDDYNDLANDLITYKLYLYLGSLLSQNALRNEILTLDTKAFLNALKTTNKAYIISSLEYLKAIRFKYYYFKGKKNNKGYIKEIRNCSIIDDYSSSKGSITIRFNKDYLTLLGYSRLTLQLPNELFTMNITKYHHSLFMGVRILLHRQVNFNKKQRNVISVKEITKYCPLLPCYDDLNESKQVSRNILEPFKKNMDFMWEILNFTWKYENELTTYNSFINNKIIFECRN